MIRQGPDECESPCALRLGGASGPLEASVPRVTIAFACGLAAATPGEIRTRPLPNERLPYYDFFAGGGMARLGLGPGWECLMANDLSPHKAEAYRANFPPADDLILRDVAALTLDDLPGRPVLSWASFPCQDLSLAGDRRGLKGERSGTFWPFWTLMTGMAREGRPVPVVVLENVAGAITSHGGRDFQAILGALADEGHIVGALVLDAVHFIPQSRPRLFIVGARTEAADVSDLAADEPRSEWCPASLRKAHAELPRRLKDAWVWWRVPLPRANRANLSGLIEDPPTGVEWHTAAETRRLLDMMSEVNRAKVREAKRAGRRVVGTIYKRTRRDADGTHVQRAEVRFDETSGCLRTPRGGSSRQTVIVVEGRRVRTRLLTAREAARLMGVPDSYVLPENYNQAYHLMGDGLAVPVVAWLAKHVLRPLAARSVGAAGAV